MIVRKDIWRNRYGERSRAHHCVPAVWIGVLALVWLSSVAPLRAGESVDLADLSLEDLMTIDVSLASRKQEKWFETPAAVYVITREDLRRAGVTSVPEALRLVPGMQVARIDANKWAVSARGLNGRFAQNLLVLIDGRTVYTPLFSGVFWEMRDVMLEDVNRIEVIRGPGGTLWGANAVNGIINIVTESAADTRGGLVKAGAGTKERGFVSARYGTALDAHTDFRTYAKVFARAAQVDATGQPGPDAWHMGRSGFRIDRRPQNGATLTLQGDLFAGTRGQIYRFPALVPPFTQSVENDTRLTGGNLLGRWTRSTARGGEVSLQAYFDRTGWQDTLFTEARSTYDIDFQYRFHFKNRLDVIWGLGYRLTRDDMGSSPWVAFDPAKRTRALYSAFWQNTLALSGALNLSFGSKFEHTAYTELEYQPDVRLLFTPDSRHALWVSATRAVHTPSRTESDARLTFQTVPPGSLFAGSPPALVYFEGAPGIKSSALYAVELGYRMRLQSDVFLDFAGFLNDYKGLRSGNLGTPALETDPLPPHLILPLLADNDIDGKTHGLECAIDWQPGKDLRMRAAYTYLKLNLKSSANFKDPILPILNGGSPRHQAFFWISQNLPHNWQADGILRFTGRLASPSIPRYLELDAHIAWHPTRRLAIAITGQNLLQAHHEEFEASLANTLPTEVQRSVYAAFTSNF